MKSLFKFFMASLLFTSATACEDESDDDNLNNNNASNQVAEINEQINTGFWQVSLFTDNNQNYTNRYQGLNFDFNSNGSLTVSDANRSFIGSWLSRVDDGVAELVITLQGPDFITELNEDWKVVRQTATEISLQDVDDGLIDELVLTKQP